MASAKARRPTRPVVEARSVLILKEKHGDLFFVVDNDEELFVVALSILRSRLKADYYYHDPGDPPPGPGFTKEEAEKLPKALQESAFSQLRRHADAVRVHAYDKAEWDDINLACSSADGKTAWRIISDRSDHEYEHVIVETARTSY